MIESAFTTTVRSSKVRYGKVWNSN